MDSDKTGYVAHVSEDGLRSEAVQDHLCQVAEKAAEFANPFSASNWAYVAGLAHDLGKYSVEFQNRILRGGPKVDHSTAGASTIAKEFGLIPLSYCIAGHHGGLPDAGSRIDGTGLFGRLRKAEKGEIPDFSAYSNEIKLSKPEPPKLLLDHTLAKNTANQSYSVQFLTRMLFSCLVDADFLCTEEFMNNGAREPLQYDAIEVLANRLEDVLSGFRPPVNELGSLRCSVSDDCLKAAKGPKGLYSLTAPTGSGKTYALMRFALQHARLYGMSRVICAEPYTSIIEQNAQVFRDVFGGENVLEHHSGFDFDGDEFSDNGLGARLRLASENWDAPIVVTTNVQLFESLYANKTSRCRKLHNLANSVIVLDEAQMIPTGFLTPCIRALAELVKHYGCTVLLSSATQPAIEKKFEGLGLRCNEIISNTEELFDALRRVSYRSLGPVTEDELVSLLADNDQALCIVNSRRQAKVLYERVRDRFGDSAAVFHLTTLMYPEHRKRVLATVRKRVACGEPCLLVATSLVEAGVDLDFPVVFRAAAGIDSMVQAAGRCNREGKRPIEDSFVYLFQNADEYRLPGEIYQRTAVSTMALPGLEKEGGDVSQIESLDTIEKFFGLLYGIKGAEALDCRNIVKALSKNDPPFAYNFESVANDFRLIEDGSFPVVIPSEIISEDLELLEHGVATRSTMRRISRYSISLYRHDIERLHSEGVIHGVTDGLYVLDDESRYDEKTGLDLASKTGEAFFW